VNPWLLFVLCAGAIIYSGRVLSNAADELADRTGLGRAFIGSLLLAGATSLPEVAASGAAALQGAGNLSMGNVFGSNTFNMLLLVIAQCFARRPILANVSQTHVTTAAAGMLLSGIAAMAMLARPSASFLGAGLDTWVILATYLLIVRLLPNSEGGETATAVAAAAETPPEARERSSSVALVWLRFGAGAAGVVVAGWYLSAAAEQIAVVTGLGETFVGSTLLAAATSLPELTVSIFTVRMGAYDLTVGNVLGSNIFNMIILFISDLLQPGSTPILSAGTTGQVVSALLGLILSGIVIVALTLPQRGERQRFPWEMAALAIAYLIGIRFVYLMR